MRRAFDASAGRCQSAIGDLVLRISASVVRRFAGHAMSPRHHGSLAVFDDRQIELAAAGIRPLMVVMRGSQVIGVP